MFIICDSSKHMQNTCIVDAKRLFLTNTFICNICGYKNIQGTIPAKHMQVAQVITLQLSPSHSSTGIDSSFACNIANCKYITFIGFLWSVSWSVNGKLVKCCYFLPGFGMFFTSFHISHLNIEHLLLKKQTTVFSFRITAKVPKVPLVA